MDRGALTRRSWLRAVIVLAFASLTTPLAQPARPPGPAAPLTILQINDVYETMPVDGRGGLARVATLKQNVVRAGGTPLLIIAGDFLSSSVASSIFKGKQMIEAFNAMGLDFATLGNHEFDFGKDVLLQRMAESKFQYLVANVLDESTGKPVGGAVPYVVRTFGGLKVGFLGLCLNSDEISSEKRRGLTFVDPMAAADGAIRSLRDEGAQAIVAITHLSYEEDRQLAQRYPEIGIIVGGHEHYVITSFTGSTLISKAGSDARNVARIDLRGDGARLERLFELVSIDSTLTDEPKTAAVVAEYEAKLGTELDVAIGSSRVPLDAESRRIRSAESNLGNLITDAMRADARTDVAIINSGSIRGDRVFATGPITRRTLIAMQPFGNVLTKIEAPGRVLLGALNHGVSRLPAAAGQFPQVSGLTMTVDAAAAPAERVRDVRVGGQPLDPSKQYAIAIPDYLLNGGDGYTMFAGQRVIVGQEAGDLMVTVLENYIKANSAVSPQVEGRITIK